MTVESFLLSKTETTWRQWDLCVRDGHCRNDVVSERWGRGDTPIVNVNWDDVQSFIDWLNVRIGEGHRLPTEAEWEYAARAGSDATFPTGESVTEADAAFGQSTKGGRPSDAGSRQANGFGLFDMLGNVWERTADCWRIGYEGAPADGSAVLENQGDCSQSPIRGGGYNTSASWLRSAARSPFPRTGESYVVGFRVARTLPPRQD